MKQALEYLEASDNYLGSLDHSKPITALRTAIEQAEKQEPVQHWCTFCKGYNAHNCQFNTTLPRVHTYVTNTTAPAAQRQWVGIDNVEIGDIWARNQTNPNRFAREIEAKLKEKNT